MNLYKIGEDEMFDKDGNYWPTDDEWNDFVEEEDTE